MEQHVCIYTSIQLNFILSQSQIHQNHPPFPQFKIKHKKNQFNSNIPSNFFKSSAWDKNQILSDTCAVHIIKMKYKNKITREMYMCVSSPVWTLCIFLLMQENQLLNKYFALRILQVFTLFSFYTTHLCINERKRILKARIFTLNVPGRSKLRWVVQVRKVQIQTKISLQKISWVTLTDSI